MAIVVTLGIACVILWWIFAFIWHTSRAQDMLDRWAQANGYRILTREKRSLRLGPYWWRKGKGQDVYYVTVEDSSGNRRSGYIRLGGAMLGMISDAVDVSWDDQR